MNWQPNKHLHSFHGGIHPPENKSQSTQSAIEKALLPDELVLPIQQHIGQPAKAIVKVGDKVLKGQLIAEPNGYISAAVHAPTSGVISAIEPRALPHPSGLSELSIVIKPDGNDEWGDKTPLTDYQQADKSLLLEHIRNAGITGLGGAGFPTSVKLNPSEDLAINTLILNAAECEPYITADDMLMRERAGEVIHGLHIMAQILQPEKCLIGIEVNKPEAIDALQLAIAESPLRDNITLEPIPVKYPSGGEKQLIEILTGKQVPHGGIPADIGIVCHNVGTAAAVYRAVVEGEPVISRITTVTGDAVSRQGNIEVLLGTPISTLLTHFELQDKKLHRLVMGGPMMGFTLDDANLPAVKATNCILAATRKELPDPAPEQACIRCGMCAEACPATLLPQQLYWFAKSREFDKALSHNLLDCIECGACSYVCPSNIPLVQYYRFAKGEIRIEEHERTAADHARQRFEARTARLEQEEAEKEAKRKARAEAAAKAKQAKESTAHEDAEKESSTADAKAAVIQAALERAKARKAKKAADEAGNQSTSHQPEKAADGLSAVERAKARKAARAAESSTNEEKTTSTPPSALEKAKAKRAAGEATNTEQKDADNMSAVERAKARKAARQAEQAQAEATGDTEKPLSALERAKAKRTQAAETNKETNAEQPMSALERAKAKRASIEKEPSSNDEPTTETKDSADIIKAETATDSPALSALERAKLKRAQTTGDQADETAPAEKPLSALDRAKAKRAATAEKSSATANPAENKADSDASTSPVDTGEPMSALERAKARRVAAKADSSESTSAPAEGAKPANTSAADKPTATMSALERAKAKRALAAKQAAEETASNPTDSDT